MVVLLPFVLSLALCVVVLRDAHDVDFSGGRYVKSANAWVVVVAIFGLFALPGYVLAKRKALRASGPAPVIAVPPATDPNAATSVAPPGWG